MLLIFRKLEATSTQNIEFLQVIAKREESIHQSQLRLEEKTRECGSLARQLEMAIDDAKRQVSTSFFGEERWTGLAEMDTLYQVPLSEVTDF